MQARINWEIIIMVTLVHTNTTVIGGAQYMSGITNLVVDTSGLGPPVLYASTRTRRGMTR